MVKEKYFWAYAERETNLSIKSKVICIVTSETFLKVHELDYCIPYEITSLLEDLGFYEIMEAYYETALETDDEIKTALDNVEFLSHNDDFQNFLDSLSKD